MDIYGKPNPEKTAIIEEWYTNSTKFFELAGGGGTTTPTHDDFIEAGWFLFVVSAVGAQEHPGTVNTLDVPAKTYTKLPTPWSQTEIDAAAALADKEAEIAKAILDGDLSDITSAQLETDISGESPLDKKNHRVTWALLQERNLAKGV